MKYFYKVITANCNDMNTGILVNVDDVQYLINVPDGF